MGIVMTVLMGVGLVMYVTLYLRKTPSAILNVGAAAIGLGALWNIFWYGLRHLETFWGQAAIISGIVMGLSALDLANHRSMLPRWVLFLLLLVVFALYLWAIVRLNLGLEIPR